MPTILKREFAPISDDAWSELDAEAARAISGVIVGRKIVDFDGPHGWELASVNLGRVDIASTKTKGKTAGPVAWGVREVLPIVEVRAGFSLKQLEIDNISRGSGDADIDPLLEVAAHTAMFEDDAILNGFDAGNIQGIVKASVHKDLKLPKDVEQYPKAVADAVKSLQMAGIGGPYAMVLNADAYYDLKQSAKTGYPPKRIIEELLEGDILPTPVLDGGVVVSTRGGDFQLTVGKDFSLGYASHDRDVVELFLTESFTFRVLEPKAAVRLKPTA
jgi:uncharacterized linocin/CFP29 family protein